MSPGASGHGTLKSLGLRKVSGESLESVWKVFLDCPRDLETFSAPLKCPFRCHPSSRKTPLQMLPHPSNLWHPQVYHNRWVSKSQVLGTVKTCNFGAPAIWCLFGWFFGTQKGIKTDGFQHGKFWRLSKLGQLWCTSKIWHPFGRMSRKWPKPPKESVLAFLRGVLVGLLWNPCESPFFPLNFPTPRRPPLPKAASCPRNPPPLLWNLETLLFVSAPLA